MWTSVTKLIIVVLLITWLGGLPTIAQSADPKVDSLSDQQSKQSELSKSAQKENKLINDEKLHEKRISQILNDKDLQHASDTDDIDNHGDGRDNLNEKPLSKANDNSSVSSNNDNENPRQKQQQQLDSDIKAHPQSAGVIKSPQSKNPDQSNSPDDKLPVQKVQSNQDKTPKDLAPSHDRHSPPKKHSQNALSKSRVQAHTSKDSQSHQAEKTDNARGKPSIANLVNKGGCEIDMKRFCPSKKQNILSLLICLQTEPRRVVSTMHSFFTATPIAYHVISSPTLYSVQNGL